MLVLQHRRFSSFLLGSPYARHASLSWLSHAPASRTGFQIYLPTIAVHRPCIRCPLYLSLSLRYRAARHHELSTRGQRSHARSCCLFARLVAACKTRWVPVWTRCSVRRYYHDTAAAYSSRVVAACGAPLPLAVSPTAQLETQAWTPPREIQKKHTQNTKSKPSHARRTTSVALKPPPFDSCVTHRQPATTLELL